MLWLVMCGLGLARKPRLGPSLRGPTAWVEVRPSQSCQKGLSWAWPQPGLRLLGENLPKLLIIQCKLAGTTRIPRKKLFSMIESIAISREELTYVPHNTGVTMSQRRSGATVNESEDLYVQIGQLIDNVCTKTHLQPSRDHSWIDFRRSRMITLG